MKAWKWTRRFFITGTPGTTQAMKPGDSGLIQTLGTEHQFLRSSDEKQVTDLIDHIRPALEQGAHRLTQLRQEMERHSALISSGQELNSIKAYLFSRQQLLDLYGESQKRFWQTLERGLVPAGARLVVLAQQFDLPGVDGGTLREMMEGRLRDWVMDLQNVGTWEVDPLALRRVAEAFQVTV